MCEIEEVKSYKLFDKLYPSREAAVADGIDLIAIDLKKRHANDFTKGLIAYADHLVYLLTMHRELHPLEPAGNEASAESSTTLSPGTRPLTADDL